MLLEIKSLFERKYILLLPLIYLLLTGNSSAQSYEFDSFIELVKKNNIDIMIAAKDLEIASAQEKEAKSRAYPELNIDAGYNRNLKEGYMYADLGALTGDTGGPAKFKTTYDNEFSLQSVLSQKIFDASVFYAITASKQYDELSNYIYEANFQAIISGSKKSFYMTLLLKEIWEMNKAAEENAEENYRNVKIKYDQGIVSQFELLQAEVRWKNLNPETTKSKRDYELALNSLKILVGIPVEKSIDIKGEFNYTPYIIIDKDIPEVLNNRPDYNALVWENKLRETNIKVEKSSYLPSLTASLTYRFNSVSNQFTLDNKNNFLIAGVNLHVPIFSGWGTDAKVEMAEIEAAQTTLNIEKTKEEITKEIKNISLRISESKNRIESADKTLESAKKAFEIAEVSTNNGVATQLELKDSRINYDKAQLNYYSAVYDYLEAFFDWELATGLTDKK